MNVGNNKQYIIGTQKVNLQHTILCSQNNAFHWNCFGLCFLKKICCKVKKEKLFKEENFACIKKMRIVWENAGEYKIIPIWNCVWIGHLGRGEPDLQGKGHVAADPRAREGQALAKLAHPKWVVQIGFFGTAGLMEFEFAEIVGPQAATFWMSARKEEGETWFMWQCYASNQRPWRHTQNPKMDKRCAFVTYQRAGKGVWSDDPCDATHRYICQKTVY